MDELTSEEKILLEKLRKTKYIFEELDQMVEEYRIKENICCKCPGKFVCDDCHFFKG